MDKHRTFAAVEIDPTYPIGRIVHEFLQVWLVESAGESWLRTFQIMGCTGYQNVRRTAGAQNLC